MNYLKFTQYVYLIAGLFFIGAFLVDLTKGIQNWFYLGIGVVAIFMFFFRRKFAKKFEEHRKNS
ncbi:hypothetical protein G4D82_01275 [Flavobacterium sp. CYK-4]|uniref:hypothetical protein n=1 Tax=Flavobacterium lotistagni TaxID=2709660 RepID=UPI001407CE7D|nr:hypothetical protein [Flavobacterium lotistagni]NHM05840.1 hypothetical protein [Flavobacterium lotistagni]